MRKILIFLAVFTVIVLFAGCQTDGNRPVYHSDVYLFPPPPVVYHHYHYNPPSRVYVIPPPVVYHQPRIVVRPPMHQYPHVAPPSYRPRPPHLVPPFNSGHRPPQMHQQIPRSQPSLRGHSQHRSR